MPRNKLFSKRIEMKMLHENGMRTTKIVKQPADLCGLRWTRIYILIIVIEVVVASFLIMLFVYSCNYYSFITSQLVNARSRLISRPCSLLNCFSWTDKRHEKCKRLLWKIVNIFWEPQPYQIYLLCYKLIWFLLTHTGLTFAFLEGKLNWSPHVWQSSSTCHLSTVYLQ